MSLQVTLLSDAVPEPAKAVAGKIAGVTQEAKIETLENGWAIINPAGEHGQTQNHRPNIKFCQAAFNRFFTTPDDSDVVSEATMTSLQRRQIASDLFR